MPHLPAEPGRVTQEITDEPAYDERPHRGFTRGRVFLFCRFCPNIFKSLVRIQRVQAPVSATSATRTRDVVLTELDRDSDGFPIIGLLDDKNWDDPVTEDPKAGSTEIWNMINDTGDAHPKHIHLVQFQVLSRQPFDQSKFDSTGQLNLQGQPQAPAPEEQHAYKDVVKSYQGTVTKLIMKFDIPTGATVVPGQRYKYVWHCHILEHEDNEMMRPMDIVG